MTLSPRSDCAARRSARRKRMCTCPADASVVVSCESYSVWVSDTSHPLDVAVQAHGGG